MKKVLSSFMAAVCIIACAFAFVACDNGNKGSGSEDGSPQTVAVTAVTLIKNQITLEIGGTETLTATVAPDNATNKTVAWESDKPAIATVSGGKVTAVAEGTATITAAAGGKSDTCTVTVNKAAEQPPVGGETRVESVTLNKTALTLEIGGSETLTATVAPDNATNKTVSWTSDKPAIAKVENGKVTALAEGTAIITATADGKSDTCTVTVNKATEQPPEGKANKYAEIVTALETRIRQEKGFENAEILFIIDDGGYLGCKIKTEKGVYGIKTLVKTEGHSLTASTLDNEYYVQRIADSIRIATSSFAPKGLYNSDGTVDEKQTVDSMIAKLLGNGYTVMCGIISDKHDNMDDPILGANADFTVNALLEKDGRVYEYSETLTVSKSYGDIYQTVLNSTEENKENRYKAESKELTDLGDVAASYLAEVKRVSAATA